jgi:hypothetical protein
MDTYQLGKGHPDGVAGLGGLSICIEIKDASKPPSKRRLTEDEKTWHANWTGGVKVVEDLSGVQETVALLQDWHRAIRVSPAGVVTPADGGGLTPPSLSADPSTTKGKI